MAFSQTALNAIFLGLFLSNFAFAGQKLRCTEMERVSISANSRMQPAYPGRTINFEIRYNAIRADGVFFNKSYKIQHFKNGDFEGIGQSIDRTEIFYFQKNLLFHSAIVSSRKSKVIQSQVFSCKSK